MENIPLGYKLKGVKTIYIKDQPVQTYCTDEGWTVIQSRGQFNNPKDFFSSKLWNDYKLGFGTPGVNFTNVLSTAFMLVDPKSVKKYSKVISNFLHFWDLQA